MKERLYLITLYDLYGNLLTDRQQTYFEEYYFNNLSLSEMSELYEVSRSAIGKSLKEIESKLNNYEDKLKIYNKLNKVNKSQLFEERGCPKNAVAFDSEKFAKELADGLYVRLNDSMCSYFKQNL